MTFRAAWPLLVAAPLALALLARPLENPDLFWHLSAGRWMLAHAAVPSADFLSSTRGGAPWIDFEWLAQLVYIVSHSAGGLPALWALKVAVLAAALWHVDRALDEQGQAAAGRAVGVLLAALGFLPSADLRPENFSLLLFAVELRRLERERREGARPSGLAGTALLYAAWANVHAGFVFGLGLRAAYALGSDLTKLASDARSAAVAAAATLVNPYGPGLYAVLFEHARAMPQLSEIIIEWRPVSLQNSWTWPFWGLLAASGPAVVWARRKRRSVPKAHLLVLAGLAAACWQTRNTPYFCLAASVLLVRLAGRVEPGWLAPAAAAAGFFIAGAVAPRLAAAAPWRVQGMPERASAFLAAESGELGGKKLYHPYGWGGYLGFRLPTDYLIFWDGRYLFQDLLVEEREARDTPPKWQAFLDERRIELALLEHDKLLFSPSAEGGVPRPFYVYFMPQQRWALVHWDDEALVFVRRDAVPPAWLEPREFRLLRPGDEAWVRRQIESGAIGSADLRHDTMRVFSAAEHQPRRSGP